MRRVMAWCLWSIVSTAAKPCPAVRRKRYLAFAATGGLGNQFYNLKTAVWVSRAADRTLILPPILPHGRLSASYADKKCTRLSASKLVNDVQARADRAYAQFRRSGHASWRRVLDLARFEATGLRFVDEAASLSVAPVPFCGSMTRGWTAANITAKLPSNPNHPEFGAGPGREPRAGPRGRAAGLRPAGLRSRGGARRVGAASRAARRDGSYETEREAANCVCSCEDWKGETATYLLFLDHAVAALVRGTCGRVDAPAVYLASDMPLGDIRKLRSRSKAVDELFELCDGGGGERCAFVGSQDDARFGVNIEEWRRRARFARGTHRQAKRRGVGARRLGRRDLRPGRRVRPVARGGRRASRW